MNFATEWKFRWPVSATFSPPSLVSEKDPNSPIGPLVFTPKPNTPISQLIHSPSLATRLPPYYPDLSLLRVLQHYDSVPSTAASISSLIGPLHPDHSSLFHGFNSLQLLQIPSKNVLIAFFPAGENLDRVCFTLIHVRDGILSVESKMKDLFQLVEEVCENRMRITRLMVNPVDDGDGDGDIVGFLMVCTNFSVYWYTIGINNELSVCLDYLGYGDAKMFKGNAVVSASWSPYLREECLVLLENGDLLLFDVNYLCGKRSKLMHLVNAKNRIICKKMHVNLDNKVKLEKAQNGGEGGWFDCEFCWHPKIFIASHRKGVFLVDLRFAGDCNVCCLLKIETLSLVKNDEFEAFSRAGSDGFYFTVATRRLLLLCDVRRPLVPVLQWAHGLQNPRFMTVVRLSELRSNAENDNYKLASESGHCIFLGSFWDNEFDTFCYGPNINGSKSVYSEVAKFYNSYYSWGLPSELSLSGLDCDCGSYLVREEFSKTSLPIWTDWRQKKQLVLGFAFLDEDLFSQLSPSYNFGGFMLIRLMSSGKLEAQQFHASWESHRCSDMLHGRMNIGLEDNILYLMDDSQYDGEKKFHHLNFEFLNAYLKDNLAQYIVKRREKKENSSEIGQEKYQVELNSDLRHEICASLKDFGFPKVRSSVAVSDMLKDINVPTSIHDIALRRIWETLSTSMLRLAFSPYLNFPKNSEKHQEPLEFLGTDQRQAPPFLYRKPSCRSNKWSVKVKPSDTPVGPLLPPQFLTIFDKLCTKERKMERELQLEETKEFSADSLFKLQCDKVIEVLEDHVRDYDTKNLDDDFVSLADDKDEIRYGATNSKFSFHKPLAFSESSFGVGIESLGCVNSIFSNHVFRRNQELASDISAEMVGHELFDVGCPVELKFEDRTMDFRPKELELFQILKKSDLDFQKKCKPYQDYIYKCRHKELK